MKIGMMIDTFLPNIGGAEIHVLELSRALHARGHHITICTATTWGDVPGKDEIPVLRLSGMSAGGWQALLRVPANLHRMIRFIRNVDVIHCHYSFLFAALGTFLGRLLGKRTLITLHGLGTLDSSVSASILFRFYRFVSMKCAHLIIATSDEMRRVALRFAADPKISVIPNGVDTGRFTPMKKPGADEKVILSMRRLAPKNGVQYLIEAAPEIVRAVPRVRFWITGKGKLETHVRRRVAQLGLDDNVRFLGLIPHDETPHYYQQADVVVFPSSAESTSLACLEAMAMGKAVVASGLAAYREMLGQDERGLLVELFNRQHSDYAAPMTLPVDRISRLAGAIIRLCKDERLSRRLGKAARQHVQEHYDWQHIAGQIEKLYRGRPA